MDAQTFTREKKGENFTRSCTRAAYSQLYPGLACRATARWSGLYVFECSVKPSCVNSSLVAPPVFTRSLSHLLRMNCSRHVFTTNLLNAEYELCLPLRRFLLVCGSSSFLQPKLQPSFFILRFHYPSSFSHR